MAVKKFTALFSDRTHAYATGNALQDLIEPPPDALTVFEDGPDRWRLEAYFDVDADERDLEAELAPLVEWPLPPFAIETVPDLNWVAISQAALPPVHAGRFTIHGSHDKGRVAYGPNAILIDAGEAFGTAHHATTLGCLLAIDRLTRSKSFNSILDLGCGSGVLAIAAAKALPHVRIIAADMDPQSVKVATENVRLNGVAARIAVVVASGVGNPKVRSRAPFDPFHRQYPGGTVDPPRATDLAVGRPWWNAGLIGHSHPAGTGSPCHLSCPWLRTPPPRPLDGLVHPHA